MAKRSLTRENILQAQDIQTEEVEVPEWGGTVLVRGLMGEERDALEASMIEGKGKNYNVNLRNLRAKLVARSVVDENGKRIFEDSDIAALGKKSATALARVYDVAQRLSGLSNEDVGELTKNSKAAPSEGSGSD
jgi:hypothetical protein